MKNIDNNPWKGIVPYSDDVDDLRLHPFVGRELELIELISIVENNAVSTLYGRSGNGKTSLLRAGLFPSVRQKGYTPIWLRLNIDGSDYASQIIDALSPISRLMHIPGAENAVRLSDETHLLWNFFGYHEFYTSSNEETTPVVVLDQFEEVLRQPDKDKRALVLLRQLSDTLRDGCLCDGKTPYTISFRVLISLREDDLFLLEDILDSNFLNELKMGRFRLRSISDYNARQIVLVRPNVLNSDERESIVRELIEKSKDNLQGHISTMMLSLMCHWIYDHRKGDTITLEDVNRLGDNPMEQFFDDATFNLDANQMKIICEESVGSDGRRLQIKVNRMVDLLSPKLMDSLCSETSQSHIFQLTEDKKHYELIHDKLAEIVFAHRMRFEEEENTRRMEEENRRIKKQNEQLNKIRSLFLSEKAIACQHDRFTAQLLALEALPKNLEYLDKPLVSAAEIALRNTIHIPCGQLQGHDDAVIRIEITPDEEKIISLSRDKIVRIWDIHSGVQVYEEKNIQDIALCAKDYKLVLATTDGRIIIRQYQTFEFNLLEEFSLLEDKPKVVAINPNGTTVAAGLESGAVMLFLAGQRLKKTNKIFKSLDAIMFCPDGKKLVAIEEGRVVQCSETTGKWKEFSDVVVSAITGVACSKDSKRLLCGTENGEIVIVDRTSGEKIDAINCENVGCRINTISVSPIANKIAYSVGGRLEVVEHGSWKEVAHLGNESSSRITKVVWSCDDRYLVWGDVEGKLFLYDTNAGYHPRILMKAKSSIKTLEYSPNGENIICLSKHNTLRNIDISTGNIQFRMDHYNVADNGKDVRSVAGRFSAVYVKNKHIIELYEEEKLKQTLDVKCEISSLIFSTDAKVLALAKRNGVVTCWSKDSCKLYDLQSSDTCSVLSLTFSPTGDRLAAGMENGVVRVWDMSSKKNVESFEGHDKDGGVRCVAFSPDGEQLAAGYGDGTIFLWPCPSLKSLIKNVSQKMILREFTSEEKRRFFLEDEL